MLPAFPALYKDLQYCASMIRIQFMRKFVVYRNHGQNAAIEADEDPVEDSLGFSFRRKGVTIARFRWAHIQGWEENLVKPRAKSTAAKR